MATINGTSGNDTLTGTSSNDTINGLGGNDTILGWSGGQDFVDGGAGQDSIEIRGTATQPLNVQFSTANAGVINSFTIGRIDFTGIERVVGSNESDLMYGAAGAQTLAGQGGQDELWGAAGNDTLWGGGGNDRFLFRETGTANADRLRDFTSGSDKLVLDSFGGAMSQLGAAGNFVAGDTRFASNSTGTAQDSSDRVIFQTSTGQVWYDPDGTGAGARELIATLENGGTLVATDIEVRGESGGAGQTVTGTNGADTLNGTAGNDTLNGLGGNDLLVGGEGADSLSGGDGNDTMVSGEATGTSNARDLAADTLNGGLGDDTYHVVQGDGDVIIADAGGLDTVIAWSSWTLGPGLENLTLGDDVGVGSDGTGNELDNTIISATEGGTISGLGGNDTLIISGGENTIIARGGEGNDTIQGAGSENDQLFGDAGNDLLNGGGGVSSMTGGAGADTFVFDTPPGFEQEVISDFASGTDTLRLDASNMAALGTSGRFGPGDARFVVSASGTAQDASDRIIYNPSTGDVLYDEDGSGSNGALIIVRLQGAPALAANDIEVINGSSAPGGSTVNGTSANDTLTGTAGNDTINGLGGNDLIIPTAGADVVDGGAGFDSIEYKAAASSGIVANFNAGTASGGFAGGSISFTGIERLVAGNFNDSLTGGIGSQNLAGQAGADTLTGGSGTDTLWGGGGNDVFLFNGMGTANADRISDWNAGDKVHLTDEAFTAIGAAGNFAAGDARFWSSTAGTAHDSNDRVIYDTDGGQLYYDADGDGSGAAQLIATVLGAPALAATDIVVI